MIIEYSHKEIERAIRFHYASLHNEPEDIDKIQIGCGDDGFCFARMRVKEPTTAAALEGK